MSSEPIVSNQLPPPRIPLIIGFVGSAQALADFHRKWNELATSLQLVTPLSVLHAINDNKLGVFDDFCDGTSVALADSMEIAQDSPRNTATYLLRNCSIVVWASDAAKCTPSLVTVLDDLNLKGILPSDTPTSGEAVPMLELPRQCPLLPWDKVDPALDRITITIAAEVAKDTSNKCFHQLRQMFKLGHRSVKNPSDIDIAIDGIGQQLTCLESFNRDACDMYANPAETANLAGASLFHSSTSSDVKFGVNPECIGTTPESCLHGQSLRRIDQMYSLADALARKYQEKWQRLSFATLKNVDTLSQWSLLLFPRSLLFLSWLAATLLVVSTESLELLRCEKGWEWLSPFSFISYSGVLIWGLWRFLIGRAERWENKHQDYRLLSEGLRVQFYWNAAHGAALAGNTRMRSYAADWLPSHAGEIEWVRKALHNVRFFNPPEPCGAVPWKEIHQDFIVGQISYHENIYIKRRERVAEKLHSHAQLFLGIFILMFVTLTIYAIAELAHIHIAHEIAPMWHHIAVGIMIVSLVVSLTLNEAKEGFALEPEMRRGAAAIQILKNSKQIWDSTATEESGSLEIRERVLFELGCLFLRDQSDWLFLHRERPIQPAHG